MKRACTFAIARHRVAVERRRDIGWCTWDLEQDRTDGATGYRRRIGSAKQNEPLCRAQLKGEWDEKCNGHSR